MDRGSAAEKASTMMSVEGGVGDLPNPVQLLIALHRRRKFVMSMQSRMDRGTEAYLAALAGLTRTTPERERKAIWKQVTTVRAIVEKAEKTSGASAVRPGHLPAWADPLIIISNKIARQPWDRIRRDCERELEAAVKRLPVWSWVSTVRGLGPLGAGCLIAEAGDLGAYPSKSHLWKRFGLAVIDGSRQRKQTASDAAALHGYSPRRRSQVYVVAESLFRAQWRKQEGQERGSPAGPYGEAYARRRAATAGRDGWTLAHQHADGLRYMSKKLVSHMRAAWIAAVV